MTSSKGNMPRRLFMKARRGAAGKDHKTPFLKFNNPFNIVFQFHFMLSKARITEPFTDVGPR